MNIFKNRTGLLGDFDSESTSCSLQNIFKLVSEIQIKLGKQGYLLENYLSCVLQAANITLAFNASQEGFHAGHKLRELCTAAIDHRESDHPFFETVKLDFEKHQLSYQEHATQNCLHFISLADDFLNYTAPTFIETQNQKLSSVMDTILPSSLFKDMIEILGCEEQIVQLNSMLRQRFFLAPIVSCYLQGFANDLLYCLNQRDCETSKQIFQLYLCEMVNNRIM